MSFPVNLNLLIFVYNVSVVNAAGKREPNETVCSDFKHIFVTIIINASHSCKHMGNAFVLNVKYIYKYSLLSNCGVHFE